MQKKTKFEFICSIHVSVTYIYICQGSTNIDAQTGYFEQYSANMDIHSKILGFRQVSCGGVSNDSIPWQSCKKRETRHVSGTGVFDGSHILQCFASMDAPRITGYLSLGAFPGNLQKI